jgi:hypothetical protein
VIVSDNSTRDHPAIQELNSKYGFAYVRQSGRVPIVEHQNACLQMPTSRWVLLLHDDDEVCSGSLDTLQEGLVNGPEAGIVMAGTQVIDFDGRVASEWLPPRRAILRGDDALLALGLDWGLRAPGTVYGAQESRRLGGLPEILGLPGDYAHAMALAYHFGIAFHPEHVGRQREGHQRTTVFDTPDKAFRWLSFSGQQAADVRTFGGSPDVADRLVDYLTWSTFEALEPSWGTFDRVAVFRLLATALAHSPHPGQAQARVRRLYPSLFWRRQRPAWFFFKFAQAANSATLGRYLPSAVRRVLRPLKRLATRLLRPGPARPAS